MRLFIKSLIAFCLVSCDPIPVPINVAKDISRSKELGLFIGEYNPKNIQINDTLQFEIVSAWTEYNFYTNDIEDNYKKKENWLEDNNWKLKPEFKPINKGHLSFLVKGDFKKRYRSYNNEWHFYYGQLIETKDTVINNNFTYFETYGPVSYDSLTDKIELQFEYYIPSQDASKYGTWIKFGKFALVKK